MFRKNAFYNILYISVLRKKMIFLKKKLQKYLDSKNKAHIFAPALREKRRREK
jgi:hypothetical protein